MSRQTSPLLFKEAEKEKQTKEACLTGKIFKWQTKLAAVTQLKNCSSLLSGFKDRQSPPPSFTCGLA